MSQEYNVELTYAKTRIDRLPNEYAKPRSAGDAAAMARRHVAFTNPGAEVSLVVVDGVEVADWCERCGTGLFAADGYHLDDDAVATCAKCADAG